MWCVGETVGEHVCILKFAFLVAVVGRGGLEHGRNWMLVPCCTCHSVSGIQCMMLEGLKEYPVSLESVFSHAAIRPACQAVPLSVPSGRHGSHEGDQGHEGDEDCQGHDQGRHRE